MRGGKLKKKNWRGSGGRALRLPPDALVSSHQETRGPEDEDQNNNLKKIPTHLEQTRAKNQKQ